MSSGAAAGAVATGLAAGSTIVKAQIDWEEQQQLQSEQPSGRERRRVVRVAAAYRTVIYDAKGKKLGTGKTANYSENGVYVVISKGRYPEIESTCQVELEIPSAANVPGSMRTVRYRARVAHAEPLANWRGVGLEFLEKMR